MVQSHHLPAVVEDGRTRRAGVCVGLVVEEAVLVVGEPDHLVLAEGDLLWVAFGMLDDRHTLAGQDLVGDGVQRQIAERVEPSAVGRGFRDRDQREVELLDRAGHEEAILVEIEDGGSFQPAVQTALVIEFNLAGAGDGGRGEDVIVRHQEPGRDEEAGPEPQ